MGGCGCILAKIKGILKICVRKANIFILMGKNSKKTQNTGQEGWKVRAGRLGRSPLLAFRVLIETSRSRVVEGSAKKGRGKMT